MEAAVESTGAVALPGLEDGFEFLLGNESFVSVRDNLPVCRRVLPAMPGMDVPDLVAGILEEAVRLQHAEQR
ncbi:MAG TPA: hypothetical protein PLX54_07980 [Candidatus Fermentibacter daniensis]|nr:hypothetical protein [Candidatus Fermentibacter daniensis]HPK52293.1 hypothetical protein [Candidatus Fermentibacter daniensis]